MKVTLWAAFFDNNGKSSGKKRISFEFGPLSRDSATMQIDDGERLYILEGFDGLAAAYLQQKKPDKPKLETKDA